MFDNLILGTEYHSNIVFQELKNKEKCKCIPLINKKNKLLAIFFSLFSKKISFIYIPIDNHKFMNIFIPLIILLNKKINMFWIGTDVLNVSKNKNKKLINYIKNKKNINHFTECDWLKNELSLKDIQANTGPYITYSSLFKDSFSEKTSAKQLKKITVLSYAREYRENFYGLNIIKELAKKRPDLEFRILGLNGESELDNLKYLGWINKNQMKENYNESHIFLRIAEHDGLSYSVLEAMYNGLYTIFNYEYPETFFCNRDIDSIIQKLDYLVKVIEQSPFNMDSHNYIKNNFVIHNQSEINILKTL